MLNLLDALLGTVLLVAGRKIFWLMVGVIGFVIGVQVATRFFHGSELVLIVAGLVLGILFAGLALVLESFAIGLAGFLGGGYILLSLAGFFGLDQGVLAWIIFLIGGIIGSVLIAMLLDWALILISTLAGASMIVEAVHFGLFVSGLAFLLLLVLGIAVQASALRHDRRTQPPRHHA